MGSRGTREPKGVKSITSTKNKALANNTMPPNADTLVSHCQLTTVGWSATGSQVSSMTRDLLAIVDGSAVACPG